MHRRRRLSPGTILVIGFLSMILVGTVLLCLPVSRIGEGASVLDSMFVAVSAVCVTGLTPVDIATTFTVFGRVVIALLIQFGGLGFASFAVFILTLLGKNVSLSNKDLAREALNNDSVGGIVRLVRSVILYVVVIELAGAVLLYYPFFRRGSDVLGAAGMALFHSVSAFNNAGFDLNGDFSSLVSFNGDIYFNIVIAFLILLGGLGFFVMKDIIHHWRWTRLSFHTKIVLVMSGILVFGGMALMLIGGTDVLDAFFMSVSARTAGFSSMPLENLSHSSTIALIGLMFIGANPGSTGGGIKTTTIFVLFVTMQSYITGRKPSAFKRRIPQDSITKAFTIFTLAILTVIFASFLICAIEGDGVSMLDVVFEVTSAVATVGLSRSLTPLLHVGSKIVVMVLMFIGRLGPLTIVTLLAGTKSERVQYIEENVLIG